MRLHVKMPAPNVLKVLLFVAETGRAIETVEADTRSAHFLAINPFGTVPVLETPDGYISESLTICRYLDRKWGQTGLFGFSQADQLTVEQWERRAEIMLFLPAVDYAHHVLPMFAQHIAQQPQYARLLAERAAGRLAVFETELRKRRFLSGNQFSMADITAYLGFSTFVSLGAVELPESSALHRWKREIGERASGLVLSRALEGFQPG